MSKVPPPLFLASQSPRRKQILESVGLPFKVLTADVEEVHPGVKNYREVILSNSLLKANAVSKRVTDTNALILSADTLVILNDSVLGKPKHKEDARQMLKAQSGKVQQVFTGITLLSESLGQHQSLVESKVHFRKLSDEEIENYISTVEPYDKAGAYAVQGISAVFIEKIEGSYTNVMGLPVEVLLRDLEKFTHVPLHLWIAPKASWIP